MDEKTAGIIIMGLIVVAFGALLSWLDYRRKDDAKTDQDVSGHQHA